MIGRLGDPGCHYVNERLRDVEALLAHRPRAKGCVAGPIRTGVVMKRFFLEELGISRTVALALGTADVILVLADVIWTMLAAIDAGPRFAVVREVLAKILAKSLNVFVLRGGVPVAVQVVDVPGERSLLRAITARSMHVLV